MDTQTLSPASRNASPKGIWFGFSAAAVAWAAYGLAWELIAAKACQNGRGDLGPLSPMGVRWLLAGINLGCLVIAVSAGVTSFHNWKQLTQRHDLLHAEGRGREQFLALGGVFVSLIFTLSIIWAGLPLIMVGICVKAR